MTSNLDQFYTKPAVARTCIGYLQHILTQLGVRPVVYVEPSAGTGSFVTELRIRGLPVQAYDLAPQFPAVIQKDFLFNRVRLRGSMMSRVVVGNPPFGKRGKTALAFLKRSLQRASIVGFILPRQFTKYGIQKEVPGNARLVFQTALPSYSFSTDTVKSISIGCVFQVWTSMQTSLPDLRLKEKPSISHKDFIMYQYNNTKEALKYFSKDFDIAIFNQGYGEYPTFRDDATSCEKNKQWLLIKVAREEVLDRIKRMDYKTLSEGNTTVPGFRKADFVREYMRLYGHGTRVL